MDCFSIAANGRVETFRRGEDYGEGHERLHWTFRGIEKIILLGLWKREFRPDGSLKSKPLRVEQAMKMTMARRRPPPPIAPMAKWFGG
jgi:hypothetical protein